MTFAVGELVPLKAAEEAVPVLLFGRDGGYRRDGIDRLMKRFLGIPPQSETDCLLT